MQRWQEYSRDPNAPDLMKRRSKALRDARVGELVDDRGRYVCDLVAGKSVLDVGVVEHTREACESSGWLHRRLRSSASRCLGVDILADEIDHLREKGFDVICADITAKPLPEIFDVIVAGEVLEHIEVPGAFMSNCAQMLRPGGRLIVTVPNPWYANRIWKNAWSRFSYVDSADHIAWYDAATLYELGQRHGFILQRYMGVGITGPQTLRAKSFLVLRPLLTALGLNPLVFANSIICEFVRS
jgi:2-polyprenyl-3-methyl-5-hydroxy-6-metoxy-1,4-benzoquinol methylase